MTVPDPCVSSKRHLVPCRSTASQALVRDPVHLRLEPIPVPLIMATDEDMYPVVVGIHLQMIGPGRVAYGLERGHGHRHAMRRRPRRALVQVVRDALVETENVCRGTPPWNGEHGIHALKTLSNATAADPSPTRSSTASTPTSTTANSSSSSAQRLRQIHPLAHGGRAGEISAGDIPIGNRVVNQLSPPNATSPWCFRTTRSTRT